jgi:hypothetical protein
VVVTRFNLTLGFAQARDPLDLDWLRRRLEPFAAVCQPAMQRQRAPHTWLVLLDARTPGAFVDELAAFDGVTPVLLEAPHDLDGLGRAVAAVLESDATHLLTTRLDSDDALADGHLERLQATFEPRAEPYFLNFPLGHMWQERRLYACLDPANPFLSYVEPLGHRAPLTAYRVAHVWAHRVAPVRQLWAPSLGMQLIAGHNEVSALDGVRSPRRRAPRGFRQHPAFGSVDAAGRFAELAGGLPRYARAHRGRLRLLSARAGAGDRGSPASPA